MVEECENQVCVLCRVCGLAQPDCIDIFSAEGRQLKIPEQVEQCLPVTIRSDDDLTTAICVPCRAKLTMIQDVHDMAIKACKQQVIAMVKSGGSDLDLDAQMAQYIKSSIDPPFDPLRHCAVSLGAEDNDTSELSELFGDIKAVPIKPEPLETLAPVTGSEDENGDESGFGMLKISSAKSLRRSTKRKEPKKEEADDDDDIFEELQVQEYAKRKPGGGSKSTEARPKRGEKKIIPIALRSCAICEGLLCKSHEYLLDHWKSAHPGESVRYRCRIDQCDFVATVASEIYAHGAEHRKFGSDGKVLDWKKEDLTEKCPVCAKEEPVHILYESHLQSHRDVKDLKCHKCKAVTTLFATAAALAEHIKEAHKSRLRCESKPYCCEFCGNCYTQKGNLELHLRDHSGFKPFSCDFCGKAYSKKSVLEEHRRSHTGERPFVCEHCGDAFYRRSKLILHNRCAHSNERPYECTYCHKGFKRKGILIKHERIHTNSRPYACQYCEKSFSQRDKMIVHTRLHTGERPYVCDHCGKGFTESGNLRKHLRVHGADAIPDVIRQNNKGKPAPAQRAVVRL